MLRFKQFLLEAPSIENQLSAIKSYENRIRQQNKLGLYGVHNPVTNSMSPGLWSDFTVSSKDNTVSSPISVISGGNNPEYAGFYAPGSKTAQLFNIKNPTKDLEPESTVFRHEMAHAYQDLAQIAQNKKPQYYPIILSTSPNINPGNIKNAPAIGKPRQSNTNTLEYPEYSYQDIEVNARAVANARKSQDWYEKALEKGMRYVDQNDEKAVQDLKNKLRSAAMTLGIKDEIKTTDLNTKWGRYTDSVLKATGTPSQSETQVAGAAKKAERTTQEKIARGLAQVENEFEMPSQAIGGIKTNTNQNNVSTTPRSTNTVNRQGMPSSSSVSGSPNINLATDMAVNMMGLLTPPSAKDRMQIEKDLNTDVGLGFDLEGGELVASPEGFEAVRRRQNQGVKFPTAFPENLYK
jgi:hypothetical protein